VGRFVGLDLADHRCAGLVDHRDPRSGIVEGQQDDRHALLENGVEVGPAGRDVVGCEAGAEGAIGAVSDHADLAPDVSLVHAHRRPGAYRAKPPGVRYRPCELTVGVWPHRREHKGQLDAEPSVRRVFNTTAP
jgi:hypothetical protein